MIANPPFLLSASAFSRHPVVVSVPHAGRCYPSDMAILSRLGPLELIALEDRYADILVATAIEKGFSTIIAQTPRAWIDLNRAENEYDPLLITGRHGGRPVASAKVRGGLGIIPRRISSVGDIWRRGIDADAFEARLALHYRPYHAALDTMLAASMRDFGIAVLIDIHSMPPLNSQNGQAPARLVIGDLFGKSSDSHFTAIVRKIAEAAGIKVAENAPYAGGHILERHSHKARAIHALQIEIDRSLYLDEMRRQPSQNLAEIQRLVLNIVQGISIAARSFPLAEAAE